MIIPSRGAADDLAVYTGLARSRIEVTPTPIIPDPLLKQTPGRPDHPWFAPDQPPLILSVGELGSRKDFPTLLRAFARVRRQRPCRLMIVGRGKQRDALLRLASELGVSDDFALPGFIPSPYAWIAHAAVFAFSSRWEGMPLVLAEALAMGTPVVSTDCPSGPAEILQQGRYGPLVAVGDDDALAAGILQMLDTPIAADELRAAARLCSVSSATDAYLRAMGL